ncbi:MAG: OmpH family outer membrane protein [Betaproteobacteria bacterium]|nr:OmpH family outer membrane protein [Betaproteobacteria bacterium]
MKTFAMQRTSASFLSRWIAIATLTAATAVPVAAQELKIGYVNSERVLREANPAKAAQAKLEAEFSKRERELNDATGKLKAAADKLEKEAPTLAETERTRRQRELVEQDRDLQRKRREFQEDLNQRRNEELAAVVERANRAIKQIFDSEKYDLILQEVVFASSRVDITEKVIRILNAAAGAGK